MTVQKEYFNTPNVYAFFDPDNSILIIRFSESCGNLLELDIDYERRKIERIVEKHRPSAMLTDLSACTYYTSGEHIRWYENTLFQRLKGLSVKKIAVVVPSNLFVHATIEAARFSMENPMSDVQYFMDSEKAFNWLSFQS
nr:STAS/SEC14 domain-containing protein [Sunxiuqinia sp.]